MLISSDMSRPKHTHIVLLGKQIDHALIGVRELGGDVVHFITSEELLKEGLYEHIEDELSKESNLQLGGFHPIPNERLFSPFIIGDMLEIFTEIVAIESSETQLLPPLDLNKNKENLTNTNHSDSALKSTAEETLTAFFVGFTGGTKLMAGSAIHCANMIGAVSYYVAEGSDSIDPEVICLGSLEAPAVLLSAPDESLETIFQHPEADYRWSPTTNLLIRELIHLNLANEKITKDGSLGYKLTNEGYSHVKIAAERKLRKKMTLEELNQSKEKGGKVTSSDADNSSLIQTLFEVGHLETEDELLQVVFETSGISGRAQIRERETAKGTELFLKITFEDKNENEIKVGRFKNTEYTTDRMELIDALLFKRRLGADADPEALRIISGNNDIEFLTYTAIKHFEKLGFKVR